MGLIPAGLVEELTALRVVLTELRADIATLTAALTEHNTPRDPR